MFHSSFYYWNMPKMNGQYLYFYRHLKNSGRNALGSLRKSQSFVMAAKVSVPFFGLFFWFITSLVLLLAVTWFIRSLSYFWVSRFTTMCVSTDWWLQPKIEKRMLDLVWSCSLILKPVWSKTTSIYWRIRSEVGVDQVHWKGLGLFFVNVSFELINN